MKTKPHRGLSEYVFQNPHIDPLTKATIVTMIRAKEDVIAYLTDRIHKAPDLDPIQESLRPVLDQVDETREELHALCQISDSFVLANIYRELTVVADGIYGFIYGKDRD